MLLRSFALALLSFILASTTCNATPIIEGRANVDFNNPLSNGGSMLDRSAGLGEPLNVIISAKSTPRVLDMASEIGAINFFRSIGYSVECFKQHIGDAQSANLGDGRGYVNETAVIRADFDIPVIGTCIESLIGGNHFRVFPQAATGALFLAVSTEENASEHHNIVPNGYDIGRNALVSAAVGVHYFLGQKYVTTVTDIPSLLVAGSSGINHGISIDGVVKMLTVTATIDL